VLDESHSEPRTELLQPVDQGVDGATRRGLGILVDTHEEELGVADLPRGPKGDAMRRPPIEESVYFGEQAFHFRGLESAAGRKHPDTTVVREL
jgi:hypothetical protein